MSWEFGFLHVAGAQPPCLQSSKRHNCEVVITVEVFENLFQIIFFSVGHEIPRLECGLQRGNIYVKPISGQHKRKSSTICARQAAGIQSINTKLLDLLPAKSALGYHKSKHIKDGAFCPVRIVSA